MKFALTETQKTGFLVLIRPKLCDNGTYCICSKQRRPYGKAVFVRISDKYAANILRTALFTVIVHYIFTSCREYPANKVGLTKK